MNAGEHDSQPTCLSEIGHTENIQNHVLHYLGCIERCERDDLFEIGNDLYKHEYKHVLQRLKEERDEHSQTKKKKVKGKEKVHEVEPEAIDDSKLGKWAEDLVTGQLEKWKNACDTEIRRIDYLRGCLAKDPETKLLVQNIDETITKWRASEEYKTNLPKVQDWSGRSNSTPLDSDQPSTEDWRNYEPEKDYNLHIIEYKEKNIWDCESDEEHQTPPEPHHFSDTKKKIDEVFGDEADLNGPADNPLYRAEGHKKLRYIHLPANNMTVSVC